MLVDDRSSAVSLPELPLLGVLPGTGGLTRLVDKRHVRRDIADYFATRSEGMTGRKAVAWRLVDEAVPRSRWDETVAQRAAEHAARSTRSAAGPSAELTPLPKTRTADRIAYRHVEAALDRTRGCVEITVRGPRHDPPTDIAEMHRQGADFWTLAMTRELDDLILDLRTNEIDLGTWVLRTAGDPQRVLAHDALCWTIWSTAATSWAGPAPKSSAASTSTCSSCSPAGPRSSSPGARPATCCAPPRHQSVSSPRPVTSWPVNSSRN
jgi:benzoyl-CoA-dihydrodiol lyase